MIEIVGFPSANATLEVDLQLDVSRDEALESVLKIFLPGISGVTLILSLTNFIVLLNLGITKSPSGFIYFNMTIMDMMNSITGLLIVLDEDKNNVHWKTYGANIYLVSFDGEIILIFGLAIVRLLCISMSALRILMRLRTIAYIVTALSWAVGVFAVVFPKLLNSPYFYPNFAIYDIIECLIILVACGLSLFTWVAIRRNKNAVNAKVFKKASDTSLAISLNFLASYTYYIFLNVARVIYHNTGCPPDTWLDVFVCRQSLYVGVSFMAFQSFVNNVILLTQDQTKDFLSVMLLMCCLDIRRKCGCGKKRLRVGKRLMAKCKNKRIYP